MSRFVAQIRRMSTGTGTLLPTRVTLLVWMAVSSLVCRCRGDVAYLVEEEGAARGHLELARPVGLGVCEGPAHVAEELALEKALGEGTYVHADHRAAGALREAVYLPGQHVLARAVLAGDEDAGVCLGHLLHYLAQLLHLRGLSPEHVALAAYLVLDLAQLLDLLPAAGEAEGRLEGGD